MSAMRTYSRMALVLSSLSDMKTPSTPSSIWMILNSDPMRVKPDISEFEWTLNDTRRRRVRVPSRDLAPDRVLVVHDNASDRRRAIRP